jgi:hypothetical protein
MARREWRRHGGTLGLGLIYFQLHQISGNVESDRPQRPRHLTQVHQSYVMFVQVTAVTQFFYLDNHSTYRVDPRCIQQPLVGVNVWPSYRAPSLP